MRSTGTAYILWFLCLIGLCGVHRLYAGKVFTGLLWLFTFGLLGIGQFIDLFLIPNMIDRNNYKLLSQAGPNVWR
ncbi:MAG: NINE protein [Pyrinomonadaceae bacterium]|nr:NINE protein [Phycisphaerales bacterium]